MKIPKDITHTRRLVGAEEPLSRFLDESYALGVKRDVLLVQLPPSFAYDEAVVADFFALLRSRYAGRVACEPRHATWFDAAVDDVLAAFDVARVAADPPVADGAGDFGGSPGFRYRRLHGSPRMYYSSYEDTRLQAIAQELRRAEGPTWCIFDNTAHGAATANALTVRSLLETSAGG